MSRLHRARKALRTRLLEKSPGGVNAVR
jgi:hypothetical protein